MKRIIAVVVLMLALVAVSFTQTSQAKMDLFGRYEAMRMDKGTAFIYTLVVPGGGAFYTRHPVGGVCIMGMWGVLAYSSYRVNIDPHGNYNCIIPFAIILKAAEMIFADRWVDSYNHEVQRYLSFEPFVSDKGPGFKVNCNF